jgi:hypothetical protein
MLGRQHRFARAGAAFAAGDKRGQAGWIGAPGRPKA